MSFPRIARASRAALFAAGIVFFFAAARLSLSAPVPDYGKIVKQSVDAAQGITETHLANGLTILSKENHAAPVAYFGVFYKVGSRNEVSGQTGLSHILEHMMFKGTKTLPPGAVSRLFQRNGIEFNAETGTDYTYYHELLSSDRLELAIRVEADRMRNSAFDPTQLSHEMTVVRSELEGDSNDPGFQLYDYGLLPTAYSAHPYHWPVIGWTSDVEAVANRRDVIYAYYQNHYMTNNATVVMVGDFDTKRAIGLCQRYFGVYASGKLVSSHITPEPTQHGERRVTLKRPGTVGEVIIGYHAPALGTQDHIVLDVIDQILSGGRSARLYQALVETGLAEEANAGNQDQKDPNLFTLDGSVRSGVANDAVEKALLAEVAKLQTAPVSADEVSRAANQVSASFIYQNDSVSEQAEQIGDYASIYDYKYINTYLDRLRKVTPADIQRVAAKYLTEDNRTVATFEPQPLPPGASPPPPPIVNNFGAAAATATPVQKDTLAALDKQFNTGKSPSLGRKTPPARVVLPNGLVVIVQENHANKTVALSGLVRAGSMFDPDGKYGVADLTAEMLQRGTKTRSALQLALALESVGAGVRIGGGTEAANFGGQCLTKDFGTTLTVLSDELRNPAFPPAELEKLRGQTLSGIAEARQDAGGTGGAGASAQIALARALYPKGHPFWEPTLDEQEQSVKAITTGDLQSFYGTYYRPDTTVLVIVGDVTVASAVKTVEGAFGDWTKPEFPAPSVSIPFVPIPASGPATSDDHHPRHLADKHSLRISRWSETGG